MPADAGPVAAACGRAAAVAADVWITHVAPVAAARPQVNREVLSWIKEWDPTVFGRRHKPLAPPAAATKAFGCAGRAPAFVRYSRIAAAGGSTHVLPRPCRSERMGLGSPAAAHFRARAKPAGALPAGDARPQHKVKSQSQPTAARRLRDWTARREATEYRLSRY